MPKPTPGLRFAGAIGLLAALAACGGLAAATPGPGASPGPTPSASATPFVFPSPAPSGPSLHDTSGTYVFGGTSEPPPGPVSACNPRETLTISQLGGDVTGSVQMCVGPCFLEESLSGTQRSGQLTLKGYNNPPAGQERASYQVTYQLRFDPASQHLVGTRNDQPFWAAPVIRGAKCGPALLLAP